MGRGLVGLQVGRMLGALFGGPIPHMEVVSCLLGRRALLVRHALKIFSAVSVVLVVLVVLVVS